MKARCVWICVGWAVLLLGMAVLAPAAAGSSGLWDPADGVAVCDTCNLDEFEFGVCPDGAGGVFVAWELEGAIGDTIDVIVVQKIDATGAVQWGADGLSICTVRGEKDDPCCVSDGAGGVIVLWGDLSGSTNCAYGQRLDASGSPLWTENGKLLTMGEGGIPTSDGAGGLILTPLRNDSLFVKRVDSDGNDIWPAGEVFVAELSIMHIRGARIVSDGSGGAIVSWVSGGEPWIYDIGVFAQHVTSSGSLPWGSEPVRLCAMGYEFEGEDPPILAATASEGGGAILAWAEMRDGFQTDIFAQKVNNSGELLWSLYGVPICTAPSAQFFPSIASDGVGGAIVTWNDGRAHGDLDIYAQRVDASGVVQWAGNGVAVCAMPGIQHNENRFVGDYIVSDGSGGAIVAWNDHRSGTNYDIYAQRIDAAGQFIWYEGGFGVCLADWHQDVPQLVSDGAGGAIAVWCDVRNGRVQLYAQRVNDGGLTDGPGIASIHKNTLLQNSPNPFLSSTRISFSMEQAGHVRLCVFDAKGRLVRVLADDMRGPDRYVKEWDGRNESGLAVPSGVYFYSLEAPGWSASKKMTLAR